MVIMSVDCGDARTGIALCDKFETLAFPKTVIKESDNSVLAGIVSELAKENKVEMIVVGNPKNMDGSEGYRSDECKGFAEILKEVSGIEVIMWDERLTTVSAHKFFNETNTRGKKRKANIDAQSAVIILQSYLDYRRSSASL